MFKYIENLMITEKSSKAMEYWPLIKHAILVRRTKNKRGEDLQYKSSSKFRLILALLISLFNLSRLVFSSKQSVFFGASSRATINKNELVDEFLSKEELEECALMYQCSNFESISLTGAFKNKIIFENLLMKVFIGVRKRLYKNRQSLSKCFSSEMLAYINKNYEFEVKELDSILCEFENKKKFYDLIFKFLAIKKISLVSSYTKGAIVSSANQLNIETKEYQHGVVAPYHLLYKFTGDTPWSSFLLPKKLVLSSGYWLSSMQSSNFISNKGLSVNGNIKLKNLEPNCVLNDIIRDDSYVLFTGQGICYQGVFDFIQDFLKTYPTLKFVYRPHPREHLNYINYTKNISSNNFLVVDRKMCPDTNSLIRDAKLHISIFSSCHFEALELLNKTYVLDIAVGNIMEAGRGDANIVFFKKAQELSIN